MSHDFSKIHNLRLEGKEHLQEPSSEDDIEEFAEEFTGNFKHGQLYWNFFQNAPVGLFVLSQDGSGIIEINRRFTEMFGYSRDQMIEKPQTLPWANDLMEDFLALVKRNGRVDEYECHLKDEDGKINTCLVSISQNKDLDFLEGTVVDISHTKKMEDVLKNEEAKFRLLSEQSLVGIMIIRIDEIVYLNQAAADILEAPMKELQGSLCSKILRLVCEDDKDGVEGEFRKLRGSKMGEASQFAYRIQTKSGEPKWVNQYSKIELYRGESVIVVNIVDINEYRLALEQKQALQQQLFHAQKMESIGRLAAGIAHDFSNLLSPIISFSDLLLDEFEITDHRREDIKQIRESAERGKDLAHQLLAFGRKQEMEFKNLDLSDVVKRFEPILRRTIREDINVQILTTTSSLLFRGDVHQVEQIIMNLALNAQDAMNEGGRLTIVADAVILDEEYVRIRPGVEAGPHVMLSINDTGEGMDEETSAKVFTPFFTTKDRGKGTGLGLSTVYGIVKQHEGNIWVYSTPGGGTTFKVYFKRLTENAENKVEKASRVLEGAPTGNETVLIVEDDLSTRSVARRLLKRLGYTTIEAKDGMAALEAVQDPDKVIHMVLTDVIMPKMNGIELYRKLIEMRPELKVLYMSGYTDRQVANQGLDQERVNFIQKPFSLKHLAGKVRQVLDERKTQKNA